MKYLAFFLAFVVASEAFAMPTQVQLMLPDKEKTLYFTEKNGVIEPEKKQFIRIGARQFPIILEVDMMGADIITTEEMAVNRQNLADYLSFKGLEMAAEEITVTESETGDIEFSGMPKTGYYLDTDEMLSLITAANTNDAVRPNAEKSYPDVVIDENLIEQGITEIIGIGQSNFRGSSWARGKNIALASEIYNGLMLQPGDEFSFNRILQPKFSRAYGFQEELVIKADTTEKELGGGVCQVSTTAYRAALDAGLKITQRSPHSYAVPYYAPHGVDAAVYFGVKDLKFENDTDHPILMQTYTEGSDLYYVFYGTSDGRKVTLSGPKSWGYYKKTEPKYTETSELGPGQKRVKSGAKTGFQSQWERVIAYADGTKVVEEIYSNYEARPQEILIGRGSWKSESKEVQEHVAVVENVPEPASVAKKAPEPAPIKVAPVPQITVPESSTNAAKRLTPAEIRAQRQQR